MITYRLDNVSKSFGSDKSKFYALRNINILFPSKGLVVIAGKSGSGKSTLLNILMGIEKISEGNIYFENKKINKQNDKELSHFHLNKVSMIYQHYNLLDELTSIENVCLPLMMKGYSLNEAKKEAKTFFQDLDIEPLENRRVSTLSGGEKQRIAIIRAIISKPQVLLCDEPTGALDTKNGNEIMKILKKLSKSILVIMVSHNENQIKKYADRKIYLKDGMIEKDDGKNNVNLDYSVTKHKYKYSSLWKRFVLKIHLKENLKKNIFSFIVLTFGLVVSFLSIGFVTSSSKSFDNLLYQSVSSCSGKISDETVVKINNSPLNFIKVVRPNLNEIEDNLDDINSLKIMNNYEFLFLNYPETTFNKKLVDPPTLIPVYSFNNNQIIESLLVEGTIPLVDTIEEVIINEEFVKSLKLTNKEAINKEIVISSIREISISTGDSSNPFIKDNFSYNITLIIRGVVKEFGFLNSPKVYYSNIGLERYLSNQIMLNYSKYCQQRISYKTYFETLDNNNQITSYSYLLFVDNNQDINKLYSNFKNLKNAEISLTIDSSFFESYSSYRSLIDTFSYALLAFSVICFLGINLILGMLSLSSFIKKKKESAILTCIGATNSSIKTLFLNEIHLVLIFAFISSIGLSLLFERLLNPLFEKSYGLENLFYIPFLNFNGVPFLLPIGLLILFLVISSLFILIPISIYKSKSISEELRDE